MQKHQPTLLSLRTGQFPVTKKTFFANKINHQNFIVALIKFLTQHGIKCNHASGDADLALVLDAVETAASFDTIVHGEDTDLLVLLLNLTTSDLKPITLKPHQWKASKKKAKMWPIQEAQSELGPELCTRLTFCHGVGGCDTTSRPYGIGKASVLSKLMKDPALGQCADVFMSPESTKEEVIEAGHSGDLSMRIIFGGSSANTLGELRYREYKKKVLKGTKAVKAQVLPPTSGSTKQYSLRTYHQCMTWKSVSLPPCDYGFKCINRKLRAIITEDDPALVELLKTISCHCATECIDRRCSCRKNGLKCSDLCGKCQGVTCQNSNLD